MREQFSGHSLIADLISVLTICHLLLKYQRKLIPAQKESISVSRQKRAGFFLFSDFFFCRTHERHSYFVSLRNASSVMRLL